ncbi:MAG: hypothetical protein AAGD34_21495 [Pseudomonadota bacterium]
MANLIDDLPRLLVRHAIVGFILAFVAVGLSYITDFFGLRTMVRGTDVGVLALIVMTILVGLTFASVQMGAAVMLAGHDTGDDGSLRSVIAQLLGIRDDTPKS